ncbi:hypothetical protein HPB48_014887 [Haemaphysalis longicornis]|uniref:TRAF1-6 MATH domain-containing protein n=1 Tax=Haemaphysalis longicornis TaxID=44386 RepID=A0A9J6G9L3_HAELO|nr:hypothetical protein HPB48_014887 [Haemaphysalis longicornis]
MTTTISSGLSMVVINPKTRRWTLTRYAGLKAEAIKDEWSRRLTEPVYIQRYLISWGIEFESVDGQVSFFLSFRLKKGIYDEFLDWPFSYTLKLCLIHPETQQEDCASEKPDVENYYKYFARPLKDSNDRLGLASATFDTSYCEENGFIKEDKLLLKLEVLL